MRTETTKRLAILAAVLVAGVWSLSDAPDAPDVSIITPAQPLVQHADATPTPDDGQTEAPEAAVMVEGTGRTEAIVDAETEDVRDARAYRQRIDDNIAHLTFQAEVARLEGNAQRAGLMEKRISGLIRRLSAFEADQRPEPPG